MSINEGLAERLVLGDGLEDGPLLRHIANGPLAKSGAAQPEDVAGWRKGMREGRGRGQGGE